MIENTVLNNCIVLASLKIRKEMSDTILFHCEEETKLGLDST
jgi:hypothetical protein